MQNKRSWLPSVTAAAALAAAAAPPAASAAGFAAAPASTVLGQPLDFRVSVRLDAGEALNGDCVSADVTVGDRRLPAGLVRVTVQPAGADSARVQVVTTQAIDEPVVAVQVSAACGSARVAQRFVLLADPPLIAPAVAPGAAPTFATVVPAVPAEAAGADMGMPRSGLMASDPARAAVPAASPVRAEGRREERREARRTGRANAGAAPRASAAPRDADTAVAGKTVAARGGVATARGERRAQADAAQRRPRRTAAAAEPASAARAGAAAATAAALALAAQTAAAAPVTPRLKLDPPESAISEDLVIDQALQAVAEAASAARAAASAASASAARIAALERTVDALRADASGSRDLAAQLSEKLARSENGGRWLWPLLAVVLLLALLAAWLARRLFAAQRASQLDWQSAAGGGLPPAHPANAQVAQRLRLPQSAAGDAPASRQLTTPIPFVTSVLGQPDTKPAATRPRPGLAWPPVSTGRGADASEAARTTTRAMDVQAADATPPQPEAPSTLQEPELHRTRPLPPSFLAPSAAGAAAAPEPAIGFATASGFNPAQSQGTQAARLADAGAPRDVTIEELIDLEQQAEFFVVLGQDDAATELLVEHLHNTGGGSPLPYLKLLEIYRRRGERVDYERMRTRFNHRFNAYAPEWGVDLQAGRTLEDYTGVIPRLQQVWVRPLDAMAELEALLFRKSRGDLFDLPAYREVLFLYSLARDLLDREASDTGNVDLLLPLADGGEFSSTSPAPFLGLEGGRQARADLHDADDRPTAPVDFDLSADVDSATTSIFDPLDQPLPTLPPLQPPRR